jgi:hypothetical protein
MVSKCCTKYFLEQIATFPTVSLSDEANNLNTQIMSHILVPIIAIIMTFGTTLFVIIVITNYLLKRRLIQSGNLDAESQKLLSKSFVNMKFDNLKWGLVILFAGIGLVIIEMLPDVYVENSALPIGIELIFIAIGFLTYFFYVKDKGKSED